MPFLESLILWDAVRMKSAYKIAFVDLDDTLLGPDKRISRENLAALASLREKGIKVVAASGRHHNNIAAIDGIGSQDWILSSHGAVVRDCVTGAILLEETMPAGLVAEVLAQGRELGLCVIVYQSAGVFYEEPSPWVDYYAVNAMQQPARARFRDLPQDGFQKILFSADPGDLQRLFPHLKEQFHGRLTVMETNPELIEFFSPRASKREGAKFLVNHLNVDPCHTLAFGDGHNDVEILGWAGCSVAMSHGRDSARKAAKLVASEGAPAAAFARAVQMVLGSPMR
jgi:Cof subfamily protein (haloacid dehalogenase superfamily)